MLKNILVLVGIILFVLFWLLADTEYQLELDDSDTEYQSDITKT